MPDLTEGELLELRKSDAWLPSEATRRSLLLSTTEQLPASVLTLPGLIGNEIGDGGSNLGGSGFVAGDPVKNLLTHCYQSEAKADNLRCVITADMVSQDREGLSQLIVSFVVK